MQWFSAACAHTRLLPKLLHKATSGRLFGIMVVIFTCFPAYCLGSHTLNCYSQLLNRRTGTFINYFKKITAVWPYYSGSFIKK